MYVVASLINEVKDKRYRKGLSYKSIWTQAYEHLSDFMPRSKLGVQPVIPTLKQGKMMWSYDRERRKEWTYEVKNRQETVIPGGGAGDTWPVGFIFGERT